MAQIKPVRITRPAGRRSGTEKRITNFLVEVGNRVQDWMIDNNRIATGKSINSLNVVITRQARPDKLLATARRAARTESQALGVIGANLSGSGNQATFEKGGEFLRASAKAQDYSDNLKSAQRVLNLSNLGIVQGQLKAAPSLQFALDGRGPGKMPPVGVIEKWMIAKKVKPIIGSINKSAYLIARKIGEKGTNPPHFEEKLQTQIIRPSFNRMVNLVAKPLARVIGRKFVRFLLGVTQDYENMKLSHSTVTLFNEALDEYYGSNVTGTNPPAA